MSINPWDIYFLEEMIPYRCEAVERFIMLFEEEREREQSRKEETWNEGTC